MARRHHLALYYVLGIMCPTDELPNSSQIARTCAIFSVSEIVVYKDASTPTPTTFKPRGKYRDVDEGGEKEEDPAIFLARILEYLETPQ